VPRARLVVLVSGTGTMLQALLDAGADPSYPAEVVAVGADRPGTLGERRARDAGLPTFVERVVDHADRGAFDAAVAVRVAAHRPDLLVLAGYMKILGPAVVGRWRVVNTHPALLPRHPGAHAVRDALADGAIRSGASVIEVDDGIDTGPVLGQVEVPVLPGDDEAALHARIKAVEAPLLVDIVARLTRRPAHPSPGHHQRGHPVMTEPRTPIRRALVSVYDKAGLPDLARGLDAAGVTIVSTGSTAAAITAAGVPVTAVSEVTGFPEVLDGRVKTLHPHVHAGLLADLREPEHVRQLADLGVEAFGLVVSNLYPFRETLAITEDEDEIVEQIDIGGPSMVRAAAKNHASVAVVTSPAGYDDLLAAVRAGGTTLTERRALATQAFRHTASYDIAVASWMGTVLAPDDGGTGFPGWVASDARRVAVLRYGENPHQAAALYAAPGGGGLAAAEQLHGKEMSFNNYTDTDAALRAAYDFDEPCVAIIKHANPCGIAIGIDVARAHERAHACDPGSAFGGVVAVNRSVSLAMAEQVADYFVEVVAAPSYDEGVLELLSKKKSIRLLRTGPVVRPLLERREVSGGTLVQTADRVAEPGDVPGGWRLAAGEPLPDDLLADLAFAWRAVRAVKSNAILLARGGATVGVGMGQVNRVDAARLAVARAGAERARGSVAASDAFFPFADGFEVLAEAGVVAVAEPGGSVRDDEVVAAAEAAGVALYLTGVRHFAH